MPPGKCILICDDDPLFHQAVKFTLKKAFQIRSAYTAEEALVITRNHVVDVVLLDVAIAGPRDGLALIPQLQSADPDAAIVMCSGHTDYATVREALLLGAKDFLAKGCDPAEMELVLERVLRERQLFEKVRRLDSEVRGAQRKQILVGQSPAMAKLRALIEKVRPSSANVFIFGETGAGKEVVARLLRKTLTDGSLEPFVAVDSATIQAPLAEASLFGYEVGAFTGADATSRGLFEEADGGIIYFDELANMSRDVQAKLLRVLQEKEIRRMGGAKCIALDFRVIAATNKRPEELVADGQFKPDLLQRLLVLPIEVPSLRERTEDLPALLEYFYNAHAGGPPPRFAEAARDRLRKYGWPGNVRELSNLVAYLAAMTTEEEIDLADLPPKLREDAEPSAGFYGAVEAFEKDFLRRELAGFAGSTGELAAKLGMGRSQLYAKLKKYGLGL